MWGWVRSGGLHVGVVVLGTDHSSAGVCVSVCLRLARQSGPSCLQRTWQRPKTHSSWLLLMWYDNPRRQKLPPHARKKVHCGLLLKYHPKSRPLPYCAMYIIKDFLKRWPIEMMEMCGAALRALRCSSVSQLRTCFHRMMQRQVSREVVDGGSVHVWLDHTSKKELPESGWFYWNRCACIRNIYRRAFCVCA